MHRVPTENEWTAIRDKLPAEARIIVDALKLDPNIPVLAMCQLNLEDIDLDAGRATLSYLSAGKCKQRSHSISEPLQRLLTTVSEKSTKTGRFTGRLFLSHLGRPFNPTTLLQWWRAACRDANVSDRCTIRQSGRRAFVEEKDADPTCGQFAEEAGVGLTMVTRWSDECFGCPHLGAAIGRQDGHPVYPAIRTSKTVHTTKNGRTIRRLKRSDCDKVLNKIDAARVPDGYSTWRDVADDHSATLTYAKGLARRRVADVKQPRASILHPRGVRTSRVLCLEDAGVTSLLGRIADAEARKQRRLTPSELAAGNDNISAATVSHWIRNDYCSLLNRPLNVVRDAGGNPTRQEIRKADSMVVGETREGRVNFQQSYLINEREKSLIEAVLAVWIPLSTVASKLEVSRSTLQNWPANGRIHQTGHRLSHENCRKFRTRGGGEWHFHASVLIPLARDCGNVSFAEELQRDLAESGALAKKALVHWQPDSAPAANGNGQPENAPAVDPPARHKGGRPRKWDLLRAVIEEMPDASNDKIAATYNRRFASPISAGSMTRADATRVRRVKADRQPKRG